MVYVAPIGIPLGIIIGLLASFVQSLGLTIQRKSHVINERLPDSKKRVEHRRPLWLLGFATFFLSNVLGSVVQIASLPVVILAPLGAVSLLWNAFLARFILGEVFSPWMILGTLFIAGGAILIGIFGIVPETTRSLEDLLDLFRRPTFIVYFSLLGAALLVALVIAHVVDYSLSREVSTSNGTPFSESPVSEHIALPANPSLLTTGVSDTITEAITTERTPLLDHKTNSPTSSSFQSGKQMQRRRILLALSYSSFSGLLSGMCLIFAKSGVELLLLTLNGNNQFWQWQAWVLVGALVVFALAQLWYLHKALVMADPTLVCPTAFCFYNLSSIMNGLVYFDQFSLVPPLHLWLVVLGMIVLIGGVGVVSYPFGDEHGPEEWESSSSASEEESTEANQHLFPHAPPMESEASRDSIGLSRSIHRRRPTTVDIQPRPLHTRAASAQFSPPGFQIGISPVSPGFSIAPRGRRTSNLNSLEAEIGSKKHDLDRRRRTVSEGDFTFAAESNEGTSAVHQNVQEQRPPGIWVRVGQIFSNRQSHT